MSLPPAVVGQVEPLQSAGRAPTGANAVLAGMGRLAHRLAENRNAAGPTTGKWREVPTLPKNSTLTVAEREELARHAKQLDALCQRTPVNDPNVEQKTLVALTKMTLVLPSATQNEISAEARGEAFMVALDDVPVWAVQAAIRSWYAAQLRQER